MSEIEDFGKSNLVDENKLKSFVNDLIKYSNNITSTNVIDEKIKELRFKYKVLPSKSQMRYIYEKYFINKKINKILERYFIKKSARSRSGVLVFTIVLKPDKFSCPKNCSYCPTETDLHGNLTQPKSYLSSEPAMLRALSVNFDIKGQILNRVNAYKSQGNITNEGSNKMEIILSGGTWESYSLDYREQVMNEIYWAANTIDNEREIKSLEEEIKINETSNYLVIGMTIETRPDYITNTSIKNYRKWGVTRVQLGVQHYNDKILEGINRECYTKDTIKALDKLKQCGFKIVCHLMPDLPNSSPEKDKWMFYNAIHNPDVQFDDVKIYPTAICESHDDKHIVISDINKWYKEGKYVPYSEKNLQDLIDVLIYYKTNIQPWIRIQRLVRDIPKQSMIAGYNKMSNLRQIIQEQMKKKNLKCKCIRCMEIGDEDKYNPILTVREYNANNGTEYYISYESYDFSIKYYLFLVLHYILLYFNIKIYWGGNDNFKGLIGFCRLRIDNNPGGGFIKELENCALIREVHVYGHSLGVGTDGYSSQHKGFGKSLVKTAEEIAINLNYKKIAIIAGVGTREYYKNKCGYHLEGTYMVKYL